MNKYRQISVKAATWWERRLAFSTLYLKEHSIGFQRESAIADALMHRKRENKLTQKRINQNESEPNGNPKRSANT